jgi:hypothetical protein
VYAQRDAGVSGRRAISRARAIPGAHVRAGGRRREGGRADPRRRRVLLLRPGQPRDRPEGPRRPSSQRTFVALRRRAHDGRVRAARDGHGHGLAEDLAPRAVLSGVDRRHRRLRGGSDTRTDPLRGSALRRRGARRSTSRKALRRALGFLPAARRDPRGIGTLSAPGRLSAGPRHGPSRRNASGGAAPRRDPRFLGSPRSPGPNPRTSEPPGRSARVARRLFSRESPARSRPQEPER